MKVKWIVVFVLAIVVSIPSLSMGIESTHFFDCTECHMPNVTPNELGATNVCTRCHTVSMTPNTVLNSGSRYNSVGQHTLQSTKLFDDGDASDTFEHNPEPGAETSHHWAATTFNADAGSTEPNRALYPNMYSQYNISTGKVTCSRCHDPHGDFETNPKLLRLSSDNLNPMTENELCVACHSPFSGGVAHRDNHGLGTHPIVSAAEIATFVSSDTRYDMGSMNNYNAATPYTNSAVLVDGGVSCMSCHGPHFTDSKSSTSDGPGASGGDGVLLRSDGPTSGEGGVRNETAQLRSNLCQDCHVYQLHGTNAAQTGCMDCHGGHSYNGGTPSEYVLSDVSPGTVPLRLNGATIPDSLGPVNYPIFDGAPSTTLTWADNVDGTATGFCEVCHGDVNDEDPGGLATGQSGHEINNLQDCEECHFHSDVAQSFAIDATQASCGGCHGFPPYKNIAGNRAAEYDANDGGYAYNVDDGPGTWNYFNTAVYGSDYFKNEAETAHKTHAGAKLLTTGDVPLPGSERWYYVGTAGVQNCQPCHGDNAGKKPLHRQDPTVNTATFRDVYFNDIASIPGSGFTATYNETTAECNNVYCHSVGAPRTGDDTVTVTRNYGLGMAAPNTPGWVGNDGNDGYGAILDDANRCSHCHGNEGSALPGDNSMNLKGNSPAHNVHIDESGDLGTYNFACGVCHENTAIDKDTLSANGANQHTDSGGLHVNGVQDVVFNSTVLYNALAIDKNNYNFTTGTCSVYCHDAPEPGFPNGTGRTADWDVPFPAYPDNCKECHDDQVTSFTGSHQEHSDPVGNGPRIACDDCHGAGSDTGDHAGHVDGVVTYNTLTIGEEATWGDEYPQNTCDKCHGFDAGEVTPLWGEDLSGDPGKYCATCHSGASCGDTFINSSNDESLDATLLSAALTGGHNRPTASGPYPISLNTPANLGCVACHITTADSPNHFDGLNYADTGLEADLLLRTDDNFTTPYLTNKDLHCLNCHGDTPGSANAATPSTQGMVTHSGKLCVACHTVHGDPVNDNIQMIWSSRLEQNQHDPSGTGQFGASNVFFITNNVAVLGAGSSVLGEGSFDEDDNSDGAISEDNADDLCAVCHIDAAIGHNRRDNVDNQAPAGHNIGTNCTSSCHSAHNDPTEAFVVAAGDSCDDCHGYPPSTTSPNGASTSAKVGAHGNGTDIKLHTNVGAIVNVVKLTEDLTDCAWCHTGADQYTYSISDDQTAGGARGNHGLSDANQLAVLSDVVNSVGFNSSDGSCANACHKSDANDGFWTDTNFDGNAPPQPGLNCDACHFYSGSVSSGDTPTPRPPDPQALATQEHDKHFDKNIQCDICHDVENGGLPVAGGLSHIGSFDFGSGADGNDGDALLDMATTEENESDASAWGVNGTDMVFNDTDNTCSGTGVAAGCHATGTPDWDDAIPLTSAGCQECHTDTTNPTFNPTTGLHNNTATLTVTGVAHDGDLDAGNGCITCHTDSPSTPPTAHIDGSIVTTTITINSTIIPTYNSTDLTCNTSCHSAGTTWAYKWTKDVYNSGSFKECNGCHGMYSALADSTGWTAGTNHATSGYEDRGASHDASGNSNYPCGDCHAIGSSSYAYNSVTNDWDATVGETSTHGDNKLQLNNYNAATNTGWTYNSANQTYGCANSCHADPPAYSLPETTVSTFDPPLPELVSGNYVDASCSGCHGGLLNGSVGNYWPSGGVGTWDDASMNSAGSHPEHITALAKALYNETTLEGAVNNSILTNNTTNTPGVNSDVKQKKLCSFCHGTPANPISGTHGPAYLPADVSSMYAMWDTGLSTPDNGTYSQTSAATCSNVDCHYNNITPAAKQWYGAIDDRDCAMCHIVDIPSDNIHDEHVNSATLTAFGIDIGCGDCHDPVTDWVGNEMPENYHIDGLWQIGTDGGGSVTFTYNTPVLRSCGTNACHNSGYSGNLAPYNGNGSGDYTWDDDFTDDCTTCHGNPNPSAKTDNSGLRHTQHMDSLMGYTCDNCHTKVGDARHIDGATDYNSATTDYTDPGCTNTCHLVDTARGDWTDTDPLACTDCHNSPTGTYVGNGANYQTSGLHSDTPFPPSITGESHDDDFNGLANDNCISCHTDTPSSSHIDNNPIQSGADITVNPEGGLYTPAILGSSTGTCTTTCHTAGVHWAYQWTTDAYLTVNGGTNEECNGCHGAPTANSWNAGTVHADDPARGQGAHAATAALTFPCSDCHGIGDNTTNAYTWDTPPGDFWWQNDGNSSHGDGNLQINYNATNFTDNGSNAFCAGSGCHNTNIPKYSFPSVSGTTAWIVAPVTATKPDVACSGCHGGTPGGPVPGYWPDSADVPGTDTDGAHTVHITELAKAIHGETIPELLNNYTVTNLGKTSNEKQLELCTLCHALGDDDHGDLVNLPAETLAGGNTGNLAGSGFYSLWDPVVDEGTRDSANYYNTTTLQCSATDCHNGRATDAGGDFNWYTNNSSTCTMCHDDDDVLNTTNLKGNTHQEHLNSATLGAFGINSIDCASCHHSDTNWTTNTPPPLKTPVPGGYHMDGIMQSRDGTYIDGVTYTYTIGSGCGTNACHTSGIIGTPAPVVGNYAWGSNPVVNDCELCHELEPTSTDHTPHIDSPYVTDCSDCHTAATVISHINSEVEFDGDITGPANRTLFNGSCANTCHVADTAGDWNGDPAAVMACVDCHEAGSGFVGDNGGAYLATSGLHVTTALNVTPHDDSLSGTGFLGGCEGCHTAYGSEPTTHMDTNWDANARFVTGTDLNYNAGVVNESTCGPGNSISDCHSDGGAWDRLWSTDANSDYTEATGNPDPDQAVCNVCHGSYSSISASTGWRTGTTHATSGATKGSSHAPSGTECEDCHAYPSGPNNRHEDGSDSITFSGDNDNVASTFGSYELKNDGTFGGWYCSNCHDKDKNEAIGGTHLFADSVAFPSSIDYDQGAAPVGGDCDTCHGDGAGKYWPDGNPVPVSIDPSADDQPGLHAVHMNALILPPHNINQQDACGYCHPFPYGPETHNNGTADMANVGEFAPVVGSTPWAYKRIIAGGDDTDGIFNTSGNAKSTCSNIDCHFDNAYTPHWYDADNVEPDAVDWKSLTVETGPNPCSIKVIYNSPGADIGLDNTTAYRYEMQVSSASAAEAATFVDSATSSKVGGLPPSYLKDELTEVIIDNLDHNDTTYYVAVRAQDTEGLWSQIATAGPAAPKLDEEAPMFYGADKAIAGDEGGAINLYWTEAEDHSMFFMDPVKTNRVQKPIRYEIWLKSEVRGDLDMADNTGYNSAILWDTAQTFYTGNAIELEGTLNHSNGGVSTTIEDDITYQMGVRACDWLDNCDDNVKTVNVTPAPIREVAQFVHSYASNGGYEMRRDLSGTTTGSDVLDASAIYFYGVTQDHAVDYYVDSFTMQFTDNRDASKVTAQLGVWDGTTPCNLGASIAQVSPPIKTTSQATFKFGAIEKL
ncbi:cytochrome c3 family protein, partial [Thermodesulfobacteriota bacterium]